MNVRLHIDRVVLEDIDVASLDRPRLRAAIEHELTRLIGTSGLSPDLSSGAALPSVPAPEAQLPHNAQPAQLGTAIATAVYGGVGGGRR